MQSFFDNIVAYYDPLLHMSSDDVIKRLQVWLNNQQCGHKCGQEIPIFW